MPESNWRQQRSPSPKPAPSMLPPLSKFYYGPAQGWTSNESSPSHNGSTWSLNPNHDMPPALPPRVSPGSPQVSQGWHSPPPSAPTASHLTNMPYISNSYALIPGASDTPVDPTWDSGPPDTSTWGVNYKQKHAHVPEPISKPSLPPRPHQPPVQHLWHGSKTPSSRLSATTIDVPLFLQPVAYDPVPAPPVPGHPHFLPQDAPNPINSPPEPPRLPPPPPQKIPLDKEDEPQAPKMIPQRPRYDPQHSHDGEQQQVPQRLRRPRFDPQHSHDDSNSPSQWQHQDQQPTIPAPQFTSFDVESALPPAHPENEPSISPRLNHSQSSPAYRKPDTDRYHAGQHLHQSSISPIGPSEQDSWTPTSKPWDSQAPYVPSPEHQHTILVHHDGQSTSTTDLSSNTAGKSTPESQQTSTTSYQETEVQADQNRLEQQGDDSFYWHSGRSSSDAEEDHSQISSPGPTPREASVDHRSSATNSTVVPREHQRLPIRSTSLSPSVSIPYGASALGFGGPSDWEYFGDYEAEEIDDEALYSRPEARGIATAIEGSAELPADPLSVDASHHRNRSELFGSRPKPRRTPPLPEISPARPLKTGCSQEDVSWKPDSLSENDCGTAAKSTFEQSPTASRPASKYAVAPSSMSPEQRLDLDEVIRAWSEAPYIGKVQGNGPLVEEKPNDPEEATDVTEASLASTRRKHMLGVDIILKGAPSLPTLLVLPVLPASIDNVQPVEDGSDPSTSPLNSSVMPQNLRDRGQTNHLSDQSEPVLDNLFENPETFPATSAFERPDKHVVPQDVVSLLSSLSVSSPQLQSTLIDSTNVSTSPKRIPLSPELKDAVTSKDVSFHPANQQEGMPEIPQGGSTQEFVQIVAQQTPHKTLDESLQSRRHSVVPEISPKHSWEDLQNRFPGMVHEVLADYSAGASAKTSFKNPDESSKIVHSRFTLHTTPRNLTDTSMDLTHKELLDKSQETHSAETNRSQIQENLKSSEPDVAVADLQTKAGANAANSYPTDSPTGVTVGPQQIDTHAASEKSPKDEIHNPYADLDSWGKASLNRFAAMLREEARAGTNKDKLNIFNVFTSRESRLRVVLYGAEDDLIIPQKETEQKQQNVKKPEIIKVPEGQLMLEKNGFVKQPVQRANTMNLQRSLKALPALPANRESLIGIPGNALAPLVIQHSSKSPTEMDSPGRPSGEDSYVMVDSPSDDAQYSPGGRPIVNYLPRTDQDGGKATPESIEAGLEAVAGANAAHSPSVDAPIVLGTEVAETKEPAYTPLKYNEPRSEVKDYLANRKSVIRPYATLTQGSLESGSIFGRGLDVKRAPPAHNPIIAPISQYNMSSQLKGDDASDMTIKPKAPITEAPPDLRYFVKADFDPLLTVLPGSEAVIHESPRLEVLRSVMEAVPDDFSFIHQSVVAWDAKAKKQREENDRQRHARQAESEQRIDSLFDDHEIGYGDISELESEFKRSEAARRADEDRSEYQIFVSDVFNLVWTRLHYELDRLIPHYELYSKLMNDTLAGKDMFEGSSEGLALAPTMSSFLILHQKLEIRHQKAFEAVLERDRRLKKTEISPWYTLSNIAKVKQLEKQFEDAEKKAIIEYCQQRDSRVNRLMDVLDQNTLRGVGANQDYMEAIMKAVRRIASGRAFASVAGSNEPTAGMEEVNKAKTITALLATSSEQIVQTFHVADMLLNSADYEVSVAKAKVAKADMAALAGLKEERAKEDQKLMRDLEHRLALIREDSRRTNDEIVKLMLFLGVQNGQANSAPPVQVSAMDPSHEARIQKALEEAKKRNASKESEG